MSQRSELRAAYSANDILPFFTVVQQFDVIDVARLGVKQLRTDLAFEHFMGSFTMRYTIQIADELSVTGLAEKTTGQLVLLFVFTKATGILERLVTDL